jgi:hypothetical protein
MAGAACPHSLSRSWERSPSANKSNETKENQGKLLGFPWIPLGQIGTFQWVTANPNKKSFPVSHCGSTATRSPAARDLRDFDRVIGKDIARCYVSRKCTFPIRAPRVDLVPLPSRLCYLAHFFWPTSLSILSIAAPRILNRSTFWLFDNSYSNAPFFSASSMRTGIVLIL